MGKSDPPPPPDYGAAAQQTAAGNLDVARSTAHANRPDQYSPQGSQTWQWGVGGDPDHAVVTNSLSPDQQRLYNMDMQNKFGLGQLANQAVGQVGSILGTQPDFSQFATATGGDRQGVTDALYHRQTAMLDPQYAQSEQRERQRLANAGFSQQDEGFGTAMSNFNRSKDAAYANARDQAITGAGAEQQRQYAMSSDMRAKQIQEAMLQRQNPINEINALRTGSQVGMPQFQAYGGQANVAGPNMSQAAGQQYDANLASTNASNAQAGQTLGTIGSIAGSAMMATGMF